MSEPQNEENIQLKIVSSTDAEKIESDETDKTEHIHNEQESVPQDTRPTTGNKTKPKYIDLKNKNYVEKHLKNYLSKGGFRTLKKYNNDTISSVIENNKQCVKQIIHAGAVKPKHPTTLGVRTSPFAISRVRTKTVGTSVSKPNAISDIRDGHLPTDSSDFKPVISELFFLGPDNTTDNKNSLIETTLKTIMSEVRKNNITDVESLITKIRVEYSNKSQNLAKELILLAFEDDTFRPVIKVSEDKLNIIQEWYNTCKQIVDVEETGINIPEFVNETDIDSLFKNINYKHKDLFVKSYIPEILNTINARQKINSMESQMAIYNNAGNVSSLATKKNKTIDELNVVVPKNMIYTQDYFYKKGKNVIYCPEYKKKIVTKDKDISGYSSFSYKNSYFGDIDIISNENKTIADEVEIYNLKSEKACTNGDADASNSISTYNLCPTVSKSDVSEYNSEYNTLKPSFGENALLLKELHKSNSNDDTSIINTLKLIIVLINPQFFQTVVVVNPNEMVLSTIFNHTEYGFIELFTLNTANEEIETLVNKQYNGITFNDFEELNQTMLSTSQFIEFVKNKKHNDEPMLEEEKTVKNFLSTHYEFSDDINKKMKASTLYDIVIRAESCKIYNDKIAGFRNRLSNYLKELGLQKKRYNDGYYYYGITEKDIVRKQQSTIDRTPLKSIDEIMKERIIELKSFLVNEQ